MKRLLALMALAAGCFAQTEPVAGNDVILRAMKDELERSRTLTMANLDKPYYIEYAADDLEAFQVNATLGAVVGAARNRVRLPRLRLRVGDYKFDNSNYIYSDYFSGTRYDPDHLSLDNDYRALRHQLWLATDRAYKTGVEAVSRKRAALKNITLNDTLTDFWQTPPLQKVLEIRRTEIDGKLWTERIKDFSAVFNAYPEVLSSGVNFNATQSTRYLLNSEGSTIRVPDSLFSVEVRATGQASDGMVVRDARVLSGIELAHLPPESEMRKAAEDVAKNIRLMSAAPLGEAYAGPVLFEGSAAGQILAELLGNNVTLPRKPLGEPGRTVPFFGSELEGRIGSRILPEFMDVVDDPAKQTFQGKRLLGYYPVDEEAVAPAPVTLVEKGRLKSFLLTRQPVKNFEASNGHARLPGVYGAKTAAPSNLFVTASEKTPYADLRKKFLELCAQRNKPYGIIVRKMDFPSSASMDEIRRIGAASAQSGGASRPVSVPLLVYRVFPDGREELVRGLRFRGFSVRSLKDILAVSEETYDFHYLHNLAPFSLMGASGAVAPVSIFTPALLFEDLELERPQDNLPKPPLVPPPPLLSSR